MGLVGHLAVITLTPGHFASGDQVVAVAPEIRRTMRPGRASSGKGTTEVPGPTAPPGAPQAQVAAVALALLDQTGRPQLVAQVAPEPPTQYVAAVKRSAVAAAAVAVTVDQAQADPVAVAPVEPTREVPPERQTLAAAVAALWERQLPAAAEPAASFSYSDRSKNAVFRLRA